MKKKVREKIESLKNFNYKPELFIFSKMLDSIMANGDLSKLSRATLMYDDICFANRRSRKAFEKDIAKLGMKCERENRNTLYLEVNLGFDILNIIYTHFSILYMIKQHNGGNPGFGMSAGYEPLEDKAEEEYCR